MSGSKDTNKKFDKRADALRANLMRRKKVKRDNNADKKANKMDNDGDSVNSVQDKGNEE